ncbi:MAG: SH3 domain-containing protein, partial [Lachnospiraceae bacterium]|nr:SH3 domain-containing protein [Lachnospiraceae bacterium]
MRIRKSEWGRMIGKQLGRMFTVLTAAVILVWCDPIVSRAEATGTVLPKTVNIRKQPDQGSEPIGSSSAGKEIAIRGKVEASGVTWYQVYVDGNTLGYVRADMVEVGEGDIPTVSVETDTSNTGADTDSSQADSAETDSAAMVPSGSGTGAQVQAQEEMAFQYATTKVQAKVRPDPSTSNNHIDSLT